MAACGTTCLPKKKTRRVRLFAVDRCGRQVITGTAAVLDWDGFETIGWQNQIDEGEQETITNTAGETCYDDQSCPVDRGQMLTFTECVENDSFMAMTGHGTLTFTLGVQDGVDRTPINCDARIAMEVLFDLPTACDALGNPICVARLYPMVELFSNTSQQVVNGKNVLRNTYTAKARLSNGRLWDNFVGNVPTGELDYWAPWAPAVQAGGVYYHQRCVPCPTLTPPVSCELRAYVP